MHLSKDKNPPKRTDAVWTCSALAICNRYVSHVPVATNVGVIAGATVGSVVAVILLLLLCFVFLVKRRRDNEDDMANEIK